MQIALSSRVHIFNDNHNVTRAPNNINKEEEVLNNNNNNNNRRRQQS